MDHARSMSSRDSLLNEKKMWVNFQVLENPSPRRNEFLWSRHFYYFFLNEENEVRTKTPH